MSTIGLHTIAGNSSLVHSRKSLCGDEEIHIYHSSEKGLSGSVQLPESGRACNVDPLPVLGVPGKLLGHIELLRRFFDLVHFTFQKDVDGNYLALNTHVSCKGGMKPKIPFQPGLALGSIVNPDTIVKMETFAEQSEKMEAFEKQINALEDSHSATLAKIESLKTKGDKFKSLVSFYGAQEAAINMKIEELIGKMGEAANAPFPPLPTFPNFVSSLESPIDWKQSEVVTDPRGFDSVEYSSRYIDMEESAQKIQDDMNESSSSTSLNIALKTPFFKCAAGYSWSDASMQRVADIKNSGSSSKVLLINAMLTTRYVRHIKHREYNLEKLLVIYRAMQGEGSQGQPKLSAIAEDPSTGEKSIYILTEAVMGGSFTGIVNFLKKDTSHRELDNSSSQSSRAGNASVSGSKWFCSGTVGGAHSSASGKESQSDSVRNFGNLDVRIEFVAQGAIPKLVTESVIRDTMRHQDQNLRKYASTGSDKATSKKSQKAVEENVDARAQELQESSYDAANAIQQTTSLEEGIYVHTPNSLALAYSDYCERIVSDELAGIPIGFNYTKLTQSDIARHIERLRNNGATKDKEEAENDA